LEGENQDVDFISSDSDASFDNNTDLDGEDDDDDDLLGRFTSRFNITEKTVDEGDSNLYSLAYACMMAIPGELPTFPFPEHPDDGASRLRVRWLWCYLSANS
jgi:hypothetical protein